MPENIPENISNSVRKYIAMMADGTGFLINYYYFMKIIKYFIMVLY